MITNFLHIEHNRNDEYREKLYDFITEAICDAIWEEVENEEE